MATVEIHQALTEETVRLHNLNVELINLYYKQRAKEIDEFIVTQYTPNLISNVKQGIKQLNMNTDSLFVLTFPRIQQNIIQKRDSMQLMLETNRIETIALLQQDFEVFKIYSQDLESLLLSAVEIKQQQKSILKRIDDITNNKLNLMEFEQKVDNILIEAGKVAKTVDESSNTVIEILDKAKNILKKKKN
ncbi:MAG: hypothetical protein ACC656_06020 [Candidatus Heimdallarchaeota archaeon]